jgi:hypothetical protein
VGVVDGVEVAGVEVSDIKVAEVEVEMANNEVADVDTRLMTMWDEAHCVAESVNVADESPMSMSSTIIFLPNPSVKEDFTLRPTAAAAFTAVRSSLSASDENFSGFMAR